MESGEQENYARNMARAAELDARKDRIRMLNDTFRKTMIGGRWMITSGVQGLGRELVQGIIEAVRQFDDFDAGNDPHGEHDFGCIHHAGKTVFWKLDLYDKALEYSSPDPTNPDVTARVITVMLADEY